MVSELGCGTMGLWLSVLNGPTHNLIGHNEDVMSMLEVILISYIG